MRIRSTSASSSCESVECTSFHLRYEIPGRFVGIHDGSTRQSRLVVGQRFRSMRPTAMMVVQPALPEELVESRFHHFFWCDPLAFGSAISSLALGDCVPKCGLKVPQ